MPVYKYPRPSVTVDAVVLYVKENLTRILLIQRKKEPFKDLWALPGGFVEMDETLEQSVARELKEETGLDLVKFHQVGAFGQPDRDTRDRVISNAFYTVIDHEAIAVAADDAKDAKWFDTDQLPSLAFDHQEIIRQALQRAFAK